MSSYSRGTPSVPSAVKQESDWEVVSYDTTEQDTVSDPLIDPFNNVAPTPTCNAEKEKSPEPVIKQEIPEQETTDQGNSVERPHTSSPYFMSEVTHDTAIEEEVVNGNEESEAIEVAPDWSWEAGDDTNEDEDGIEEHEISKEHGKKGENVFIDVDYN